MSILVAAIIAVLLAIAALHLYWGFGGLWPGRDAADLVARVAGWKARRGPSLASCAAVAAALAGAAWIVAVQGGAPRWFIPDVLWTFGIWAVFAVFFLRGLAAYTPAYTYARGTPFYDLNRRYYGPLCVAIAAGIAAICLQA
jgi:hypothetical protein